KLLDRCASGWQVEVANLHTTSGRLFLSYHLSIYAEDGIFTREATDTELLQEEYFDKVTKVRKIRELGDPSSNSQSMALYRAAAKFGLGLYLYRKD
ncbi:MAG TPA: hypothetical protein V6D03_10930, partial [Candidatus Caenarcaniphilales bacterium]